MATSPLGMPRGVNEPTVYDAVGGDAFFRELVDKFYDNVEADAALLAVYPDLEDLAGARERFYLFLCQFWGGPRTYTETRGHPRLRLRHMPFVVNEDGRDRWLAAMRKAMDDMDINPGIDAAMWEYFVQSAEFMRNDQVPGQ